MGWNALYPPKLSDNPIGHIRLNTFKVCKHPMPFRNPSISYLLWPVRSPPNLIGVISNQKTPFASTREVYLKFRYKYANVVPHANPPKEPTSFTSGHIFPRTLLPLLSVKSSPKLRRKPTTRGFCNLCQVLTIYTNTGVGNMHVALNNYNQLLPRIMMIDNVTVRRVCGNCWCLATTSPPKQTIMMSLDAGTCKTSNMIILSPGPTLQLQDY
ncbi:hypothetical protein M9H77_04186 [Catharanthus roseus]|uniref:Uncharacterized protein n=1 Tax=Catharanthus roseus TaxID=4058 RepID=A0ACC0CDA2_CATRO|nr:hypothetical protein M9H77_04186 [Catharanthus roseus]